MVPSLHLIRQLRQFSSALSGYVWVEILKERYVNFNWLIVNISEIDESI